MESKTLTFDWRVDVANPARVEVWFREHPELIRRGAPHHDSAPPSATMP
jgi:hypothetical protein